MAEDQRWPAPSRDDVGGLPFPGASMPSLPNNSSKRPGKKLLSRGRSAAIPTRTSGMTSGCLRGSLCSNQRTLLRWSVIFEESSPTRFFCLLLRLQLFKTESDEFLHLLSGRIQLSQRESQPQLGYLSVPVKSCLHCGILGGKSRASLGRCIHIPQEFLHGGLHVGLPGPQGCTQVISSNDLEPEELHHERLRQGLVDLSNETHLLHRLEVEVVHLIHDLSHLLVNFLPF